MSNPQTTPVESHEAMPLPKWLMRVYYIFPVVLYIPDAIFNYYVYSDGIIKDVNSIGPSDIPQVLLFGFLSTGIVGMAWLLSVFAPWHWARKNYFQSFMCWAGVIVATSVTIWNSLAFRSQHFSAFNTDHWLGFNNGFSITMILVAVAPPFWGLFWAIVQPSENKRSRVADELDFQAKLERTKQEAELKRVRAETNAQIRTAQIQGFAATARAARAQIGGAASPTINSTDVQPDVIVSEETVPKALPAPSDDEEDRFSHVERPTLVGTTAPLLEQAQQRISSRRTAGR